MNTTASIRFGEAYAALGQAAHVPLYPFEDLVVLDATQVGDEIRYQFVAVNKYEHTGNDGGES